MYQDFVLGNAIRPETIKGQSKHDRGKRENMLFLSHTIISLGKGNSVSPQSSKVLPFGFTKKNLRTSLRSGSIFFG